MRLTKKSFVLLLCFVSIGCAQTTKVLRYDETRQLYYLNGDLDSNAYQAISDLLSQNKGKKVTIVARSNGGRLVGLEGAMDAIHTHGQVYWKVPSNSHCYSACAVLGLSANKIDGILNFHSIFSSYKNTTFQLLGRNDSVINRLTSYGYDKSLVEQLFGSVNIYKKLEFIDGVLQKQDDAQ